MGTDTLIKTIFLTVVILIIAVVAYYADKQYSQKGEKYEGKHAKKTEGKHAKVKVNKNAKNSQKTIKAVAKDSIKVTNENKIPAKINVEDIKPLHAKVKDNQKTPPPLSDVYKKLYEDTENSSSKATEKIRVKLPEIKSKS